jgi:dipeptidyl aminopeptidase/acylaminoacyl peptidase
MHLMASKGYVVSCINFHGSSGFGQKFTDSITGDMATKPFEDVMKATDWLEAQPYIDKTRIAAVGASYGGYMMAWLRSGDDLLAYSPLAAVGKLNGRPIFITHGTADTRVSPTYAADLAAEVRAHGGSVDPWMVDGAQHTQAIVLQPAEYERRLDAFFKTALSD